MIEYGLLASKSAESILTGFVYAVMNFWNDIYWPAVGGAAAVGFVMYWLLFRK